MRFGAITRTDFFWPSPETTSCLLPSFSPTTRVVSIDCGPIPEDSLLAVGAEAALSAGYLPENPRAPWAGQRRTKVLEIPIGSDGLGSRYQNILHIEQSDLDNLTRIWDALVARAEAEGRPQIVHALFHTGSTGKPEWVDRFHRFLDLVPRRRGQFITTSEARLLHDRLSAEAVA